VSTYAKLFSSIVHSTIWREPNHVRLVWITMLALKDRDGIIEASIPGLADAARVEIRECEEALDRLSSPDPYSRTKAHDGRRIEEVAGGWRVLNNDIYRERESEEQRRLNDAARAKRYRDRQSAPENASHETIDESAVDTVTRHAPSRSVTDHHVTSHRITPSETETDQRHRSEIPPNPPGGGAGRVETRAPTRPKPADPFRATFRTQCPDRFDFTEAHRGLAKRGSIDISLEWRGFSKKAQASTKHLTDWGAAFEAHLSECVQRIERAAAYRATDRNAPRHPVAAPVASDSGDPATLGAPPVSQTRPVANPDGSRKLRALIGGIG